MLLVLCVTNPIHRRGVALIDTELDECCLFFLATTLEFLGSECTIAIASLLQRLARA